MSSCAPTGYDYNIYHMEDIRKNVSSSDVASNSTATDSTTSYFGDVMYKFAGAINSMCFWCHE